MKPKIVFLDLEGTLVQIPPVASSTQVARSAWTTVAHRLGVACLEEEEASKKRWELGEYSSYLDWMEDSVLALKRHGLTGEIFKNTIDSLEETPGIRRAASNFHKAGASIAIISGGFKRMADRIQLAIKARHAIAACDLFFDRETDALEHWNLLPSDYTGKVDFMRLMIREYGCSAKECVFVGDGNNDAFLAAEVGVSIAFNAQEGMRKVASYTVNGADFSVVADIVANHPEG